MSQTVIELAVTPSPPEALPILLEALAGAGGPRGVVACERTGSELRVRWDVATTPASVLRALLRTETGRFGGSYTVRLLEPLSVEVAASVAADGLQTAGVVPERILDVLVEGAHGRT